MTCILFKNAGAKQVFYTILIPAVLIARIVVLHAQPESSSPRIFGKIVGETGKAAPATVVYLGPESTARDSAISVKTDSTGYFGFHSFPGHKRLIVTPELYENPLNGVSTYDLVLISKHILGLKAFDSPYKWIAADVNKTNSITSLDVAEIRKLILGIYSEFPNNTSWRFIDKDYSFPNPSSPFSPAFPEDISIDASDDEAHDASFVAVKIGDVNNTAQTGARPANRPTATLSWPLAPAGAGEAITVPVIYTGADTLEAIQMGFRFDPARLQLLSPSQGALPYYTSGNFGLTKAGAGEIRSLWLPSDYSDPEQRIAPGTVLFYLSFKVLSPQSGGALPLQLDESVLACAAWRADGTEYALSQATEALTRETSPAAGPLYASVRPNPGAGALHFDIMSDKSAKARISLFGPYGTRVLVREIDLEKGAREFALPEAAQLPAGVYIWKVHTKTGDRVQGHWIKL